MSIKVKLCIHFCINRFIVLHDKFNLCKGMFVHYLFNNYLFLDLFNFTKILGQYIDIKQYHILFLCCRCCIGSVVSSCLTRSTLFGKNSKRTKIRQHSPCHRQYKDTVEIIGPTL